MMAPDLSFQQLVPCISTSCVVCFAMPEKRKHENVRMLDLVIATRENTAKLGYFVDDTVVNPGLGIPYYKTVTWTSVLGPPRCLDG